MNIKFKKLNNTIIKCKKCPRLSNFIQKISLEKRTQNIHENYWGKPVTGFGDIKAKWEVTLFKDDVNLFILLFNIRNLSS